MYNNDPSMQRSGSPGVLAIVTLVLAIAGLISGGLASVAALVTGYIESANIEAGRSPSAGEGINRAGIIIAWITLLLGLGLFLLFIFVFGGLAFLTALAGAGR